LGPRKGADDAFFQPNSTRSFNSLHTSKGTNGIVIATEKKTSSPLIDDTTIEKVSTISPNIGLVYSGMGPDARVLVDKARKKAQEYKRIYNEEVPTVMLVKEVAGIMQEYTQSGWVDRPSLRGLLRQRETRVLSLSLITGEKIDRGSSEAVSEGHITYRNTP
jgi:hypothetical protein